MGAGHEKPEKTVPVGGGEKSERIGPVGGPSGRVAPGDCSPGATTGFIARKCSVEADAGEKAKVDGEVGVGAANRQVAQLKHAKAWEFAEYQQPCPSTLVLDGFNHQISGPRFRGRSIFRSLRVSRGGNRPAWAKFLQFEQRWPLPPPIALHSVCRVRSKGVT